jgi:hypothetical protein
MRRQNSGVGHASEQQEARLKGREQLQTRALANRQQQVSQQESQQDRMKRAAEEEFFHSRQQKQQQHEITGEQGSIQRHEFIKDLKVLQRRLEERERERE